MQLSYFSIKLSPLQNYGLTNLQNHGNNDSAGRNNSRKKLFVRCNFRKQPERGMKPSAISLEKQRDCSRTRETSLGRKLPVSLKRHSGRFLKMWWILACFLKMRRIFRREEGLCACFLRSNADDSILEVLRTPSNSADQFQLPFAGTDRLGDRLFCSMGTQFSLQKQGADRCSGNFAHLLYRNPREGSQWL